MVATQAVKRAIFAKLEFAATRKHEVENSAAQIGTGQASVREQFLDQVLNVWFSEGFRFGNFEYLRVDHIARHLTAGERLHRHVVQLPIAHRGSQGSIKGSDF